MVRDAPPWSNNQPNAEIPAPVTTTTAFSGFEWIAFTISGITLSTSLKVHLRYYDLGTVHGERYTSSLIQVKYFFKLDHIFIRPAPVRRFKERFHHRLPS